jgi:hypothetical protein
LKTLNEKKMYSTINLVSRVFSIIALLISILGVVFNILSFIICLRVKNNSTFIFMTFFALSNIVNIFIEYFILTRVGIRSDRSNSTEVERRMILLKYLEMILKSIFEFLICTDSQKSLGRTVCQH